MLNIVFYLPQCMNAIMLSVIMLNVVTLSVIMLSAVPTRLCYTPRAIYLYAWCLSAQL
jgi:hypothetical protein